MMHAPSHTGRVLAGLLVAVLATGCSSGDDSSSKQSTSAVTELEATQTSASPTTASGAASTTTSTVSVVTTVPEPVLTSVDISKVRLVPVPEGSGVPQATATTAHAVESVDVPGLASSYIEQEFEMSGEAITYSGPSNGSPTVATTGNPYVTRVVVRRPADISTFSGRVFVEPFNTSAGVDSDVVWGQIGPMLQAEGDGWVGISVRLSSAVALQSADPVRYANLSIPTNDIAWDMIRQLGGLVKQGGEQSPFGAVGASYMYLGGYSQSGIDVATFASAFNGSTRMEDGSAVFDGYLPAAHSGSMTPLQSGDAPLPSFENVPMAPVDVPVIDIETQTDVDGFSVESNGVAVYTSPSGATIRRADSDTATDKYRLYELAGAPHAAKIDSCDGDGSRFPTPYFVRGAVDNLFRWAEEGVVPSTASRLELASQGVVSVTAVDELGNAIGGVRSPFLDVPLARYEAHSTPGPICQLDGRETALTVDVLVGLYGTQGTYLDQFTVGLDATIASGFLRESDRDAVLAIATAQADTAFAAAG